MGGRRWSGCVAVGAGGCVVRLIGFVLITLLGGGGGGGGLSLGGSSGDDTTLSSECQTGADAEQQDDCRIVAVVNSVQEHWSEQLQGYRQAETVFFSGQVSTGCGAASS